MSNTAMQRSTATLRAFIMDVIGNQQLTVAQLHAQLACDIRFVSGGDMTQFQLASQLKRAVRLGFMCEAVGTLPTKYYVPAPAYCAEKHGQPGWAVVKYDEGRFNGVILGSNFTEADALMTACALNERDRKVRAFGEKP